MSKTTNGILADLTKIAGACGNDYETFSAEALRHGQRHNWPRWAVWSPVAIPAFWYGENLGAYAPIVAVEMASGIDLNEIESERSDDE